ncbi:MAG: hypothetical protein LBB81_00630 [Treponema sp.]|nr:hypothetical protein [Treponema sp.]
MKKFVLLLMAGWALFNSCSTGEAVTSGMFSGSSSEALLFHNCKAVSEDEIEFEFSKPVKIASLSFEPFLQIASIEEGSTVIVKLDVIPEPGILFTADLLAEDNNKNSINVLVPFRSRNNRMPKLVINELRTENSKPKAEFIEFKMESTGNLGAMRVFIAANYKNPMVYEFMPVEVQDGEYVVLHLRCTESGCVDEYGSDLAESGGTDSSATARDFWVQGNTKFLHKTDAVYMLDQDDKVLDCVMITETPDPWWNKEYFADAAQMLFEQGVWKATNGLICAPVDSVQSAGTTATRTICRDENIVNSHTASDWYIAATSCATPGKPNNPKRYVPK